MTQASGEPDAWIVDAWGHDRPKGLPERPPFPPLADWPQPIRNGLTTSATMCWGCNGASDPACCKFDESRCDPGRTSALWESDDPHANGVRGRRRREFFARWLRLRQPPKETG